MKLHLSASTTAERINRTGGDKEKKLILPELNSLHPDDSKKHEFDNNIKSTITTINPMYNSIIIHHHEGRALYKNTNLNQSPP